MSGFKKCERCGGVSKNGFVVTYDPSCSCATGGVVVPWPLQTSLKRCVFDKAETDYEQELPGGKVPLCIDCFIRIEGAKRGGPMKSATAWTWRSRHNADGTPKPSPLHETQQRLLDVSNARPHEDAAPLHRRAGRRTTRAVGEASPRPAREERTTPRSTYTSSSMKPRTTTTDA